MPITYDDEVAAAPPVGGRIVYDDETPSPQGRIVYDDEPLQPGRGESAWNSIKRGFVDFAAMPAQAIANTQQAAIDLAGEAPVIGPAWKRALEALPSPVRKIAPVVTEIRDESNAIRPVNPEFQVTNTIASAVPTALGMAATGGAAGAPAVLGLAGAMGAQQGFETADEIGVKSPAGKLATAGVFGALEAGVESIGGFGGHQVVGSLAKRAIKGGASEVGEEVLTGAGQDLVTRIAATEDPNNPGKTDTGYDLAQLSPADPRYWEKRALEALGGAVGGTVFAGVEAMKNSPAEVSTAARAVPEQSSAAAQSPENASVTTATPSPVAAAEATARETADAGSSPAAGGTPSQAPGAANASEFFDSRFSQRMAQNENYAAGFRAAVEPLRARHSPEAELDHITAQVIDGEGLDGATDLVLTTKPGENGLTEREHIALAGMALRKWQAIQSAAEQSGDNGSVQTAQDVSTQLFDLLSDAGNRAGSNLQVLHYLTKADPGLTIAKVKKNITTATSTNATENLGATPDQIEKTVAAVKEEATAKASDSETRRAWVSPAVTAAETESRAKLRQAVQRAEQRASRLIYRTEERLRQGSKDLDRSKEGDSINKVFRDEVAEPMGWEKFQSRLAKLNVGDDVAARLHKTAQRERADQDAMEVYREGLRVEKLAQAHVERLATVMSDTPSSPDVRPPSPVAQLVKDSIQSKDEPSNLAAKFKALGVFSTTATQIEGLIMEARRRAVMAARDKAAEKLIASLTPQAKTKARAKLPKMIDKLLQSSELGMRGNPAFLKAYAEAFGLPQITPETESKLRELAQKARALPDGPLKEAAVAEIADALDELKAPGEGLLTSVWYANLLSGASTQGINIFGNFSNLFLRGAALSLVNHPKNMLRYLAQMRHGVAPASRELVSAVKTGLASKGDGKYSEISRLERIYRKGGPTNWKEWAAVIGTVGPVGKYTGRLLTGMDAFFSMLSREAYAGLAASKAARKTGKQRGTAEFEAEFANQLGLGNKTWENELHDAEQQLRDAGGKPTTSDINRQAWANIVARRPMELNAKSQRFGDRTAFKQDPEGSAAQMFKVVTALQNTKLFGKVPVIRPFVPFAKFAVNALDNSLDYTPVGAARAALGRHLFASDDAPRFDSDEIAERLGASILGSTIAALFGSLAWHHKDEDDVSVPLMLYSMGPPDAGKRKLMPPGWRPYTIKVGNHYLSYAETPLALALAPIGAYLDWARYSKDFDEKSAFERLMYAAGVAPNVLMKQGVLSSLDNFVSVLKGERPARGVLGTVTSGFVPASGALRDVTRLFDPTKISGSTIAAAMFKDVPVVRNIVGKPDLNYWGEHVKNEGIPIINRIVTARRPDPLGDWIIRNRLTLPGYPQTIELGQYLPPKSHDMVQRRAAQLNALHALALTPEQSYEWHQRAGQITRASLESTMSKSPVIDPAALEGAQRYVNAQVEAARRHAMAEMATKVLR